LTCGFATPRRRRASTFSRRHGRAHPAFGCLALGARACGASRAGPECVRLRLHPHSVRGQVPARALERARLARLWPAASSGEAAGHRGDRGTVPLAEPRAVVGSSARASIRSRGPARRTRQRGGKLGARRTRGRRSPGGGSGRRRAPGNDDPGGSISLQYSHGSKSGFEASVVGLYGVVGMNLCVMQGRR